jgi:hypothetical protein
MLFRSSRRYSGIPNSNILLIPVADSHSTTPTKRASEELQLISINTD